MDQYKFLDTIDSPADLKKLGAADLEPFCAELRDFIVRNLASNPGHLGSSLGVVELTAALHYVFNTPQDKIVWDVGHQAYAHKIITGRRDTFHTNRKLGGISGFPKMSESPYDSFGGGHTSVSISAALGIAAAAKIKGEKNHVVAVIGDGALSGGLSFEGLNNAGAMNTDLLVILNDNEMSIDPNVGAMREYLLSITTSQRYNKVKRRAWDMLRPVPGLRRLIQKTGNAIKQGLLQQSNLFESLNFRYFGPVDGHDVKQLTKVLSDLRNISGPKVLHVLTVKGKGYKPAESDQSVWHAPGKFDPDTGRRLISGQGEPPRYQDVFGHALTELAGMNPRIVGITPAMPSGCSMNIMMQKMPDRCFDVGIAEGHAVTFSAGLAAAGLVPFCNIYSSFMQRAYDNIIHDVALQNLGVVFCLDRAGLVGEDGPTHHGAFDVAYLRPIPNLVIASPRNECELRDLMFTAQKAAVPFVIRYPRGKGTGAPCDQQFRELPIGKSEILRQGSEVAVLSFGPMAQPAEQAVRMAAENDGPLALHADLRYAKPLDEELLHMIGQQFRDIITIEDGVVAAGVGSAVMEFMDSHGYPARVHMLGIGDTFVEHGTQEELYHTCGYDTEGIYRKIMSLKK